MMKRIFKGLYVLVIYLLAALGLWVIYSVLMWMLVPHTGWSW